MADIRLSHVHSSDQFRQSALDIFVTKQIMFQSADTKRIEGSGERDVFTYPAIGDSVSVYSWSVWRSGA